MWQIYSKSYFRGNKGACAAIMAVSGMAAMFLSLLCSLGYNLWTYEIENGTAGGETVTPLAALFVLLLAAVSLSLALIIRSAFEITIGARVHQFGILSSVGATPGQIRVCLMQEAAVLCGIPIGLGTLLGMGLCWGAMAAVNYFAQNVPGRQDAVFQYHAGVLLVTLLASGLTVLVSQRVPARKLSKLTPIQAIRNGNGLGLKRRKRSRVLAALFGIEGELAGNGLKARKKALRIANVSLLLSFLGFSVMLCFTTLSSISTRHTYFERYRDCWDVMVTVKNTDMVSFAAAEQLQELPGVREAAVYQKVDETWTMPEDSQSAALLELGGYEAVAGQTAENGSFVLKAPMVILDDGSFLAYCRQSGIQESLEGVVIQNRIWDSVNSNFRYKKYVPFVRENVDWELPVLGYVPEAPALREEYPNYALVQFVPLSLWQQMEGRPESTETYVRIFTSGDASLEDLDELESRVATLLSPRYEVEIENRVREQISNDRMIEGMQWMFGSFCGLLAAIGLANVFSNTLGFLRSRKREFAQYLSVGLTPGQMKKIFWVEAMVIAGKPLLITLPAAGIFAEFMARASYLDSREFWAEAPILPVLMFAGAIVFFVALAYYLGGKSILNCDLNETLRKDALM